MQSPTRTLRGVFDDWNSRLGSEILHARNVRRVTIEVGYDNSIYTARDNFSHRIKVRTQCGRVGVVESNLDARTERRGGEVDASITGKRDCSASRKRLSESKDQSGRPAVGQQRISRSVTLTQGYDGALVIAQPQTNRSAKAVDEAAR
jgi:hypothetical protein